MTRKRGRCTSQHEICRIVFRFKLPPPVASTARQFARFDDIAEHTSSALMSESLSEHWKPSALALRFRGILFAKIDAAVMIEIFRA